MSVNWLSPSAPLLLAVLWRELLWLAKEEGTNGAAYIAEDGEAGVGFPVSTWVGTNGFAEDVKPFPTGLPSHLDVASDITGCMEEISRKRTRLEVPAPAARDRSLLVNAPTQPPWRDAEPLKDSALLGRLQSFLPAMQKANEELELAAAKEPESCNIESVAQDAPHIEMNLACGVLDLKDDSAAAAAQRAVNLTNSSEALDNLPTLKEDEDVVITEPDFLDMSRAAAGAAGSLMTERASRRIGKADQKHADNSSMGGKTEAPCYLEENEDHSNATLDPQPVPSKPSTSNTGGTSAV